MDVGPRLLRPPNSLESRIWDLGPKKPGAFLNRALGSMHRPQDEDPGMEKEKAYLRAVRESAGWQGHGSIQGLRAGHGCHLGYTTSKETTVDSFSTEKMERYAILPSSMVN